MTHSVTLPSQIDAVRKVHFALMSRQLRSLAGQEHGRIIPLAEVAPAVLGGTAVSSRMVVRGSL
jgi:hypothetical protein